MHEGHRERLRDKFLKDPKALAQHELLELLLFYALPRRNTNETAHELINTFGSIKDLLDADVNNIAAVPGMGKISSILIKVCAEMNSRYAIAEDTRPKLDTFSALSDYLVKLFVGTNKEISYLLALSNSCRLIAAEILSEGAVSGTEITTYKISRICGRTDAASIVLAHNHPDGSPEPSREDIFATHILAKFCSQIKVNLIDHFVVAGNVCTPILNEKFAMPKNIKENP